MTAAVELTTPPPPERRSRRASTRRHVVVPCQAVRERDFRLVADRTIDISIDGLLLPLREPLLTGEALMVVLPIPGAWIEAQATVVRIVHGRRPGDDGVAVGVVFETLAPACRAALAEYLHGRPPPLPRRGPFARLRRGERAPQLADQAVIEGGLVEPDPFADFDFDDFGDFADVGDQEDEIERDEDDQSIDAPGLLRAIVRAWQRLVAPPGQ